LILDRKKKKKQYLTTELICSSNFRELSNYTKILYLQFTEEGQNTQIGKSLGVRTGAPNHP